MTPTLLRSLTSQEMLVTIEVQVSRKWEFHGNSDIGSILHIDMILADKEVRTQYLFFLITLLMCIQIGSLEFWLTKMFLVSIKWFPLAYCDSLIYEFDQNSK
jgi:hypothetical protein